MLRASDVEIAALGPAALHLSATLKLPAGAVPVDPTPDGLAAVLSALGTVRAGSRVLVPTYADTCAPEPPYCAYGLRAPASCALYVPRHTAAWPGGGATVRTPPYTYQPRACHTYRVPWHHRCRRHG